MALYVKLNLRDAKTNERILPAYFSDGYFTLMPGESRDIEVDYPDNRKDAEMKITAEAYNVKQQVITNTFHKKENNE